MDPVRAARWKSGALGLVVGLGIGALCTGVVYVSGRERLATAQARAETRIEEGRAAAEGELTTRRQSEALLTARVAVARALEALDQANFGTAREEIRAAGIALSRVDAAAAGIDPVALDEATRGLEQASTSVPPDVATWREQLRALARAIDGLTPPTPRG